MTPEAIAFKTTPIITFGYVMQVIFSLFLVLAFIYLVSKFVLPRLKAPTSGRLIKVLDRVYLEPQITAYVLSVGKSAWLVVTGGKQVTRIDKLDEESVGRHE